GPCCYATVRTCLTVAPGGTLRTHGLFRALRGFGKSRRPIDWRLRSRCRRALDSIGAAVAEQLVGTLSACDGIPQCPQAGAAGPVVGFPALDLTSEIDNLARTEPLLYGFGNYRGALGA